MRGRKSKKFEQSRVQTDIRVLLFIIEPDIRVGITRSGPKIPAADQLEGGDFLGQWTSLRLTQLCENIQNPELSENIRILDVLTKLGFWPFWP